MNLDSLDHVHFSVPDLARAQQFFAPWVPGEFTPVYGAEEMNAFGVWNMSGLDLIQVIDPKQLAFGASRIESHGILSVSFRVRDVDAGISEATAAGLRLRSRVGSEDIGMGKNVIQAQFHPEESFGLGIELVERQIPGDPHVPLNRDSVDYIEHTLPAFDGLVAFLDKFLESPFEAPVEDREAGSRSVRNPRFGIQLTEPTRSDGPVAARLKEQGPGLHAMAFQSRDLTADIARARRVGLEPTREREVAPGVREVEFAREAGMLLRLVQRGSA